MTPLTILFLDDDPGRVPWLSAKHAHGMFVFVRDMDQFCTYLSTHAVPDVISFDHDLAPAHYEIGYCAGEHEKTGDRAAAWAIEAGIKPQLVIVHSWNPVGARHIADRWRDVGVPVIVKPFSPKVPHL